jgi:hypothetical protein
MSEPKPISGSAEPRHIGVAVEGHCRGLLSQALAPGQRLERSLPYPTVVNPDAVIVDADGSVASLAIITQWQNADNSHMKYYRTLAEYNSILKAWQEQPSAFSPAFLPLTMIYGAPSGWKRGVLDDLKRQCPLMLFLPEVLGAQTSVRLTARAFEVYNDVRVSQASTARLAVEAFFSDPRNLDDDDRQMLAMIAEILSDNGLRPAIHNQLATVLPPISRAKITNRPFRTRYRQGLLASSFFTSAELTEWLVKPRQLQPNAASTDYDSFIRRALFLDLVTLTRIPRLGAVDIRVDPRRPVRKDRGREEYAPEQLDFESWEELGPELSTFLLEELRRCSAMNPRVFAGATKDLAYGNWTEIIDAWRKQLPRIVEALMSGDEERLIAAMDSLESFVTSESWQVQLAVPVGLPVVRQLAVSALATAVANRRQLRELGIRSFSTDSGPVASALLAADRTEVSRLIDDVLQFVSLLKSDELDKVADLKRPELLSLGNSSSWISSVYGNFMTNSTYNPLAVAMRQYLIQQYRQEPLGWPNVRSVSLKTLFPTADTRVQWAFAVPERPSGPLVLAELKSVTANHWGDKSKEIYARAAMTRQIAQAAGTEVLLIGAIDGDVDAGAIEELSSGLGYDIVLSARELMAAVADELSINTSLIAPDAD